MSRYTKQLTEFGLHLAGTGFNAGWDNRLSDEENLKVFIHQLKDFIPFQEKVLCHTAQRELKEILSCALSLRRQIRPDSKESLILSEVTIHCIKTIRVLDTLNDKERLCDSEEGRASTSELNLFMDNIIAGVGSLTGIPAAQDPPNFNSARARAAPPSNTSSRTRSWLPSIFERFFLPSGPILGIQVTAYKTIIYVQGMGVVVNEPSIVAIEEVRGQKRVLAVGDEAKLMLGRTPGNIRAIRPLRDDDVTDFEVAGDMIKHFIRNAQNRRNFASPQIVACLPADASPVRRRILRELMESAGACRVYLMDAPMAAAIGAGLPVADPVGSMVVDVGGVTTEVAVLSLGGIVLSRSARVGGNEMDDAIIDYIRRNHNMVVSEGSAERIKWEVGSACPPEDGEGEVAEIKGRDLMNGVPKELVISERQIAEAMAEPVGAVLKLVKGVLESTPPELADDIVEKGLVLTGGGALLGNLDYLLRAATGLPISIADDPISCGIRGVGRCIEELANGATFPTLMTTD